MILQKELAITPNAFLLPAKIFRHRSEGAAEGGRSDSDESSDSKSR